MRHCKKKFAATDRLCLKLLSHSFTLALNALSQFAKKLKKFFKENGVNATLTFIMDTLFSPWLTDAWFDKLQHEIPQLRFLME